MSLKTSLTPGFSEEALNPETTDSPSAQESAGSQSQDQTPNAEQGSQQQNEPAIPYPRFQEVAHENQTLRQQVQEYQNRLQQVQTQHQAPSHGLSGMQQPQQHISQETQQQINEFRARLDDPKVAKEWQRRIATEGPNALYEFVEQTITERGNEMLQEALRPIVSELMNVRGSYVNNTVQQYTANVNDPEFPAYRHLFEQAVRDAAPQYGHLFNNPQALDTIRYWAQAQYRAQNTPQVGQQAGTPQGTFQPPVSERPGSPHGLPTQGTQNRFAQVDADLASKFGLTPEDIQEARSRTVRNY